MIVSFKENLNSLLLRIFIAYIFGISFTTTRSAFFRKYKRDLRSSMYPTSIENIVTPLRPCYNTQGDGGCSIQSKLKKIKVVLNNAQFHRIRVSEIRVFHQFNLWLNQCIRKLSRVHWMFESWFDWVEVFSLFVRGILRHSLFQPMFSRRTKGLYVPWLDETLFNAISTYPIPWICMYWLGAIMSSVLIQWDHNSTRFVLLASTTLLEQNIDSMQRIHFGVPLQCYREVLLRSSCVTPSTVQTPTVETPQR